MSERKPVAISGVRTAFIGRDPRVWISLDGWGDCVIVHLICAKDHEVGRSIGANDDKTLAEIVGRTVIDMLRRCPVCDIGSDE